MIVDKKYVDEESAKIFLKSITNDDLLYLERNFNPEEPDKGQIAPGKEKVLLFFEVVKRFGLEKLEMEKGSVTAREISFFCSLAYTGILVEVLRRKGVFECSKKGIRLSQKGKRIVDLLKFEEEDEE